MKKIIIGLLFLGVSHIILAQKATQSVIRGTRFGVVLPNTDWQIQNLIFTGVENLKARARIFTIEFDSDNAAERTRNAMLRRNKTAINTEKITIDGTEGNLTTVKGNQKLTDGEGAGQFADFITKEATYRVGEKVICLFATYPMSDEMALKPQIQAFFDNFRYQRDRVIDPLEKVNFKINYQGTVLLPSNITPMLLELRKSGNEDGGDEPSLVINQLLYTPEVEAALGTAEEVKTREWSSPTVHDIKVNSFENQYYSGYEATALDNDANSKDHLIYLVIMKDSKYIYRIRGESPNDFEGFLTQFRQITESIRAW